MSSSQGTQSVAPLSYRRRMLRLLGAGLIAFTLCGVFLASWSSTMAQSNATVDNDIVVAVNAGAPFPASVRLAATAASHASALVVPQVITTVQLPKLEGEQFFGWAISVNPATGYAYVSNAYSETVTVLSGTQIITNLVLGSTAAAVVDPGTGYVYVPTYYPVGGLVVLSGTQIVTKITGLNLYTPQPNPATGLIYAGDYHGGLIILKGTEIITTLTDIAAAVIGINPASGYVYAAHPDACPKLPDLDAWSCQLTILSGTNVITTVELGDLRPVGISANPVTGYVYVAAWRVNDPAAVVVLSGTQVITTLAVPAEQVAVNPSSGYAYAYTTMNPDSYVTVLSGTQAITTVPVGQGEHAIDIDPTTGYVYVSNTGSNDVSVMSGTRVVKTLEVGPTPVSVAVNSMNGLIYVANRNGQSVSIIQELLEPQSMTSSKLLAPDNDLVIDFGEPMITTSIQFAISPALLFTVTWSPASDRAIISHDLFEGGRPYALSILPGGHTISGLTVAEQSFNYRYLPFHLFAPTMLRFHQPEVAQRLTFDPANDTEPALSPDGQTVIFLSDRTGQTDIFSASTTGSQATNLSHTPLAQEDTPVYSPDGTRIAFASNRSGDWDIYLMNADGTNVQRTIDYTGTDELQPAFTPDGNSLLFSSNVISGNWDIYSATLGSESSSWVRLTTDPALDRFPTISADGTTIAFRSERDGNSEIYVMDANGSHQRRVTNEPTFDGYPSIMPDGSGIVFTSWRSGTPQVYSMNLDGMGLITWTTRAGWEADHPRLSYDGRRLVYAARSLSGTFDIFTRPFVVGAHP